MLRPSTYPRSRSADRNAATLRLAAEAERGDSKPISGRTGDGCAGAGSGHTTAVPPTSVMKSRRRIGLLRRDEDQFIAGVGLGSTPRTAAKSAAHVRFGSRVDGALARTF